MSDVMRTGRPVGAKDRAPGLPPRKVQGLLNDVVERASAGDLTALATLAAGALLARQASLEALRHE